MQLRRLFVLATLAVSGLALDAAPAHAVPAAVSAPAANQVWYAGDTRQVTWTVDGQTGSYRLELWNASARVATIGTGADITVGHYRWTIPTSIASLVAEDLTIKVIPTTGATIVSSSFDLRQASISNIKVCWGYWWGTWNNAEWCAPNWQWFSINTGKSGTILWNSNGVTGPTVKIDLVRTVNGTATVFPLSKETANDGSEDVVIPTKLPGDNDWNSPATQVRITPTGTTTALAGTSAAIHVFSNLSTPWAVDTMFEENVTTVAGQIVPLRFDAAERPGDPGKYLITAKTPSTEPIEVYNGPPVEQDMLEWRPPAPGVWTLTVTDAVNKGKKVNGTHTVTATASTEVVRQLPPSDTSAVIGQPITLSWEFLDGPDDEEANDTGLPVDISVINSSGKVAARVVQNYVGSWHVESDGEKAWWADRIDGSYVWKPTSKLTPGTYTVRIVRSGTTVASDQTITVANPTTLTVANLQRSTMDVGEPFQVTWEVSGSDAPVDVTLVPTASGAKSFTLAKKVSGGHADVTIPGAAPAGTYKVTVTTNDKFGDTKVPLSAFKQVNVVVPTIAVFTGDDQVRNGGALEIAWEYSGHSALPVKLEVFKGAGAKPVAVATKSAPSDADGETGSATWRVPATLAAGSDYVVKATVIGPKTTPVTASSAPFTIAPPSLTVSNDPIAQGVTMGETVEIHWTSNEGVNQNVTVSIVKAGKVVQKVSSEELTVDGHGTVAWLVTSKTAAGEGYSIQVTDNDVPARTASSASFSVADNPTTAG